MQGTFVKVLEIWITWLGHVDVLWQRLLGQVNSDQDSETSESAFRSELRLKSAGNFSSGPSKQIFSLVASRFLSGGFTVCGTEMFSAYPLSLVKPGD